MPEPVIGSSSGTDVPVASGTGVRDLAELLRTMRPRVRPGAWVFVTVDELPAGAAPLATFAEDEGLSLLIPREQAAAAGLAYDVELTWISLSVHSALDAVGLTAAVSTALARHGISCNVVAARFHDHLLVPSRDAARAEQVLTALARGGEAPVPS